MWQFDGNLYRYPSNPSRTWEVVVLKGGDGNTYAISVTSGDYNIYGLDEHGCSTGTICGAPFSWTNDHTYKLELGERIIGQYLALMYDCARFRQKANGEPTFNHGDGRYTRPGILTMPEPLQPVEVNPLRYACTTLTCRAKQWQPCKTVTGRETLPHANRRQRAKMV